LHVVVMGVAGCGKSEVGARLAQALGLPLVEGDAFHPPANVAKMRAGQPLDDADRAGWLALLAAQLASHPGGVVLTCSALGRAYRDTLRAAVEPLHFAHLRLTPQQAHERVAQRPGHFYPPSLVASQFATLEDPAGEPGVVTVDAGQPLDAVVQAALRGLGATDARGS
jgi:gluconokinase